LLSAKDIDRLGGTTTIQAIATDGAGNVGQGHVTFSVATGQLSGTEVELDPYGKARVQYSCAQVADPTCASATSAQIEGTWNAASGPIASRVGVGVVDPGASLSKLRWAIPCQATNGTGCNCVDPAPVSTIIRGTAGISYDVTLRFRGVIEQQVYVGGTNDGAFWQIGGAPFNDGHNVYRLQVSSPAQTFYLNRGVSSNSTRCWPVDYTKTLRLAAGATVTLTAQVIDGAEITNNDGANAPLVIHDVPPAPEAYNGQFIQMDVVDVARVP